MAAGHEGGCHEKKKTSYTFFLAKDYRKMTSGWQRKGTVFQEIRPGVGIKTGDFVQEKLVVATVERLTCKRIVLGPTNNDNEPKANRPTGHLD